MRIDYRIDTLPAGIQSVTVENYEYWILLSGDINVTTDFDDFSFRCHEVLELPANSKLSLRLAVPATIGKLFLRDFNTINLHILHHANKYAEILTNAFLFALQMDGVDSPFAEDIHSNMEQVLHHLLMTMDVHCLQVNPSVALVLDSINRHFTDPEFNLTQLIERTGYSPGRFRVLFKEATTLSPVQFLNMRRIEHASLLIKKTPHSLTVAELANACGFRDTYYFSKKFKQLRGCSPSEYAVICRQEP